MNITLKNTKRERASLTALMSTPRLVEKVIVRFKEPVGLPYGRPGEYDSKIVETERVYHAVDIFFGPGCYLDKNQGIEDIAEKHVKIYYEVADWQSREKGFDTWESRVELPVDVVAEYEVWFTNVFAIVRERDSLLAQRNELAEQVRALRQRVEIHMEAAKALRTG